MTPAEVQQKHGVSTSQLSKWRSQFTGPKYTKLGGKITYKSEDVAAWLATPRYPGWMKKGLAR